MHPRHAWGATLALVLLAPTAGGQEQVQRPEAESASQTRSAAPRRAPDRIQLEQYLDWEDVQDPQLSPDGRQIIYTRRWVDKLNDRWESSLWIMNADGSRNRFLVNGSNARWSPDGTRIAYVAKGEPSASQQIFVRWMDAEGAMTQVSRLTEAPSNLEWSPDGKSIAFNMNVAARDNWSIPLPTPPKGAKWTEPPRIVQRLQYRRDRQGYVDDYYTHLFVVSAEGGTARQVTSGNWNHGAPRWTRDGRRLVFSALRVEDAEWLWRESDIYVVDVASGSTRQLTTRKGPDNQPTPSPDGRLIAYTGYDSTDATWVDSRLYVMNADGAGQVLLAEDASGGLAWSPDGTRLAFCSDRTGSFQVFIMPADGSQVRQVSDGLASALFPEWSPDGRRLVFEGTTAEDTPGDLYVVNADGTGQHRITADPAQDAEPAWSPDGRLIAFVSDRAGNPDIYLVRPDGSGVRRLDGQVGRPTELS